MRKLYSMAITATTLFTQASAAGENSCMFIVDAGSTGSRLYGVIDDSQKIHMHSFKKSTPGISTFVWDVAAAHKYLMKVLSFGKNVEKYGCDMSKMRLSVLATAGMRSLQQNGKAHGKNWTQQHEDQFWNDLRSRLETDENYPYDNQQISMRTITGHSEGLFALLAANYLSGSMSDKLEMQAGSYGMLDLGGSSTQLALFVQKDVANNKVMSKFASPLTNDIPGTVSESDEPMVFVRSFPSMGMEAAFGAVQQHYLDIQKAANQQTGSLFGSHPSDDNPCHYLNGTACYELVSGVFEDTSCRFEDRRQDCFNSHDILNNKMLLTKKSRLFAISAFFYVADFANWWLSQICSGAKKGDGVRCTEANKEYVESYPRITTSDLKEAAASMCTPQVWQTVEKLTLDADTKHQMTGKKKALDRCFELNYIAVLLEQYGLGSTKILVSDEVGGVPLEWSMGAYLQEQFKLESVGDIARSEL